MSALQNKSVLLVGAGPMAEEYCKVLKALNVEFKVAGRGIESAKRFQDRTDVEVLTGNLKEILRSLVRPEFAIIVTSLDQLAPTTRILAEHGVRNILVEKPGMLTAEELQTELFGLPESSKILIAYNRRFYASSIRAQQIIMEDGGVTSFNFEFTEWPHDVKAMNNPRKTLDNWFLANSSHVVDLAFFLGGNPEKLCTFTSGKLEWHNSAAVFAGAGISVNGALFSYQANWDAPGRWSVEILTRYRRLIFRPMERLQLQKVGSVAIEACDDIDYALDLQFKPGLFRQTDAFLRMDHKNFCSLNEQREKVLDFYMQIANYNF